MRFAGRVAIVTGAARGIGRATALRLGGEGARVVLADLRAEDAAAAAREVLAQGAPAAIGLACDVSDEAAVLACVDRTVEAFGAFDVVVNNAGVMHVRALELLSAADVLDTLRVDLPGAFLFTKQAFLRMGRGGSIVNVSSVHAEQTTPGVAAYAAAKAGLLSLTRSAAIEGRARGIRVNAVLPGAVDTPMLHANPNIASGLERIDAADVGRPEDVPAAIAWLASDDAAFVRGASLRVDGGRLDRL